MPSTTASDRFWAVIPAGGAGTRLWPLSRAASPKFLHDLTGTGRTLLQGTVDRLQPLCADRLLVVTGVRHAEAVAGQLPTLAAENLIAEPSPRESMPAIGLAAAILEHREPQAVIGSFAADQVIRDDEAFRDCVREAISVARSGSLVTIGIEPTGPSTAFGYIRLGDSIAVEGAPRAHAVDSFVEKPDADTAAEYLATGRYRWNAGMFVVQAAVLMQLLADYQPSLAQNLRAIAAEPRRLAELWPALTKLPIDTAVAEPAAADGKVAVIPGGFEWDDVGDFASLTPLVPESSPGLRVLGDSSLVLMHDASGLVAPGSGRTVVVLGIDDAIVVDTPDAVLVTTADRAQEVKKIVDALKASGRERLT